MIYHGTLSWNIDDLSKALVLPPDEVCNYFKDGRRISFLLERRLATEVLNARLASSEAADFDIIDNNGDKWEVRCVTNSGVYFCPSYMVGSGREFNIEGFIKKINNLKGYVLVDIVTFPIVKFWIVPVDIIQKLWDKSLLGPVTQVSRNSILNLLNNVPTNEVVNQKNTNPLFEFFKWDE